MRLRRTAWMLRICLLLAGSSLLTGSGLEASQDTPEQGTLGRPAREDLSRTQLAGGPVPLQTPSWPLLTVDLHGATTGLPSQAGFYPSLDVDDEIPSRGFGAAVGAHTYPARLGVARIGLGASVMVARGTLDESTSILASVVTPQVSFNFGTPLGWSYVSGGAGVASLRGRNAVGEERPSRASGPLLAYNVGGGARWFVTPHLAFSFDLRVHRVGRGEGGITGPTTLGAASLGLSFKP